MSNSSLPTETLAAIVEALVSEYTDTTPGILYKKFTPRWYLIPLLQVSKRWNAVGTKYLYRTIAIGSHTPFQFPAREGEDPHQTNDRRQRHLRQMTTRKAHEVAEDLHRTLSSSSGLAALVTKLQLGIESVFGEEDTVWTESKIGVLQLCTNVQEVDIHGFERSELNALVDVLKGKSLLSFSITTQRLSDSFRKTGGNFFQIYEMMRVWPKLRSIRVERFLNDKTLENAAAFDTSQVSGCCPDVREIIFLGGTPHASTYKTLLSMCNGGVTKLALSLYGSRVPTNGDAAVADALCECLRAWSPTLQYLKIDIPRYRNPSPCAPLSDALTTLRELRELQLWRMKLEFGSIAQLPLLERFACVSLYKEDSEELQVLASHLEDPEKFPSLNHIAIFLEGTFPSNLRDICRKREIQLEQKRQRNCLSTAFLFLQGQ